jgi:hypothetical protein
MLAAWLTAMKTKLALACLAMLACEGANLDRSALPLLTDYRATPPPHNAKWAILLCKPNDDSSEPTPADYYRRLFTEAGAGTGGLFDYWRDQSYGNVDLTGSVVSGWFTVPHSTAEERTRGRDVKIEDCIAASGLDLSGYYDVVAIYNVQMDMGSWGVTMAGRSVMGVVADNLSSLTGIAHEMGHGFSLDHSFDDTNTQYSPWGLPGEYGDPFDIMSAMGVNSYVGVHGVEGPGLNAWGRYVLGWMPGPRIALWNATGGWANQTFTLAAINHPEASGNLMLRVPIIGDGSQYIVELVMSDGWDQGNVGPSVLIHRIKGGDWHSYLVRKQWGPRRLGGTSYNDVDNNVAIIVNSIDTINNTASITVQLDHLPTSGGGSDGPPEGCYYDAYGHLKCTKQALQNF